MGIFDVVLIIIIAGFVFYGFFFGLIRTIGSLVGMVGGLWLTMISYLDVFEWVKNLFFGHELAGKIITFFIVFTIVNRLVGFGFSLLDKAFDLVSIIPFLKTINRLTGAALGFIEAGLILGLALLFISQTSLSGWLVGSKVAPFLVGFAKSVTPFLPGLLDKIKEMI